MRPSGFCSLFFLRHSGRSQSVVLASSKFVEVIVEFEMATVWAAAIGAWSSDDTTGWSHTVHFADKRLSTLMDQMNDRNLRGRVSRLAIVAHGDVGGRVELDPILTPGSLTRFRGDFQRLRYYLNRNAMVSFASCIAGSGDRGTRLLTGVSRLLPGRTIVASVVWGCFSNAFGSRSAPGNLQVSRVPDCRQADSARMSPWVAHSKWAFGGEIVRWPQSEQGLREGFTCGNPDCPTHRVPGQRCTNWAPRELAIHRP